MKTPTRILLSFSVMLFVLTSFGGGCQQAQPAAVNEHLVMSTLWFQTSAEMRALSYQAFALARMRVDQDLTHHRSGKGRAIVVDIDETVLDNSPHTAKMILDDQIFPYAWQEWIDAARAEALPGAVEFLTYADAKGYAVFYVSNRSAETEAEGTLRNLAAAGFPQVRPERLLLKTTTSSKRDRRSAILEDHEILLLMGDNLNDLSEAFERRSVADRFGAVDSTREAFGSRFIVLPNPMYGDWESAVYDYRRDLTQEMKSAMRKERLRGF